MRLRLLATAALMAIFAPPPLSANGGWNDPTSDQFHIQTDEGPERYFRYQTQSGQYRKEKRLEDGTVVGSYGWIDSNGLLRLRDYIADNAGYRILRTKDVYVGRNRPISQAIKAAKKAPSSGGVLDSVQGGVKEYLPPSSTPISIVDVSNNDYGSTGGSAPISIVHNTYQSSTEAPQYSTTTALPPVVSLPSTVLAPHPTSTSWPPLRTSSTPLYVQSTTPGTVYITSKPNYSQSTPLQSPVTSSYVPSPVTPSYAQSPAYDPSIGYQASTLPPPIDSNSLDYYQGPQYEHYDQKTRNPHLFHNGPTYPIDRNGNPYLGYNVIGNGYDPQYSTYDGTSVTNDGFRYYIPRAYHEEQNQGGKQSGSFGYIDPFGIRRVIYYNAGANGFQHRKNNRYVGFAATPYDPRPYD